MELPEVYFRLRWPDGEIAVCYSPSTIVEQYFKVGRVLTIRELMTESEVAFSEASERVRLKYGFACSSAADQLHRILEHAKKFDPDDKVTITEIPASK